MRPHPIYIIGDLLTRANAAAKDGSDLPPVIDANCPPSHAFRVGYMKALQDMTDAIGTEKLQAAERGL